MNISKLFNSNKGISTPILLSIVVLSVILAGSLFMYLQYPQTDEKTDIKSTEQTETEAEAEIFEEKTIEMEKPEEQTKENKIILSIEFCEKITLARERDECYKKLSKFGDAVSVCKKFENKDNCYWNFAKSQNNFSLCEKINFLPYRNACYLHLAFYTKNSSLCEKLEDINISKEELMDLGYIEKSFEFLESKENCKVISGEIIPWKTYQDSKYGYQISYPNNFFVSESNDYVRVSFTSPENVLRLTAPYPDLWDGTYYGVLWGGKYYSDFMYIHVENIKDEVDLEGWIAEEFNLEKFKEFDISPEESDWNIDFVKKIIIGEDFDDVKGIKVHGWTQAYEWNKRYIKHWNIIVIQNDVFSNSENTSIFNQMLSSFRFCE